MVATGLYISPDFSEVWQFERSAQVARNDQGEDFYNSFLLAVQVSMDCRTTAELVARLPEMLPQNSAVTRQRNTSTIVSRFFPVEEIDQLPRQILRLYEDEDLLAAVMRVLFLEAEPLVGQLVAERLSRLPAGTALPKDFFVQYTLEALGKRELHVSHRCCTAARVLFMQRLTLLLCP